MRKHFKTLLFLGCLLFGAASFAQVKIGDNPTSIDNSAALEIESTNKGLLTPRMTEAQRLNIDTPANGLLVYQTDETLGFYYYDGTAWQFLNNKAWSTSGNEAGVNDFIGTTNQENLKFFARGKRVAEFGVANDSVVFKNFQDTIVNSNYNRTHFKNALHVNNNGSFNRLALGIENWVVFNNTTLDNATAQGHISNISFDNGSSGTFLSGTANFGNFQALSGSNVILNNATALRGDVRNLSGSNSIIRTARGLHVSGIDATGSDPGNIHRAIGISIGNSFNASGGDKNLIYPIYSESNQASYFAGGIGVGVSSTNDFKPHSSAVFEVNSTTQGFLPPRMTGQQMSLINSPAEGLVVYCTDCLPIKGLRVFDGSSFVDMNGNAQPLAEFTFTGNYGFAPNFYVGKVMNSDNSLQLEINVTTPGRIVFSSNTTNGYSFSNQVYNIAAGIQYITVFATGTQTAYNASGDSFTITGEGVNTETLPIVITNSQLGSEFSSFSNGTENFSDNVTCAAKPISANHTASTCFGTVSTGSNTYNMVLINGQCWMQSNLNETPTAPCADAPNTGCNVWLSGSSNDLGSWGYYNTTANAGWGTTPIAAADGLLYQFSALMKGSTSERAQGICPTGWHIPSDCEWMYLEHGLGMSIADQNIFSGTVRNSGDVGGKLSTFTRLTPTSSNGTGSNISGFTARLSGARSGNGSFTGYNTGAFFASSSLVDNGSIYRRQIASNLSGVIRVGNSLATATSVRCIKD